MSRNKNKKIVELYWNSQNILDETNQSDKETNALRLVQSLLSPSIPFFLPSSPPLSLSGRISPRGRLHLN